MVQKSFDLDVTVLFCQFGRDIPVVQKYTTVHGLLVLAQLFVTFHCIFRHTSELESICKFIEQWVIFRDLLDYLRETVIILNHGEALDEALVVFSR